ncbi:hypothetical protein NUACC21_02200 [Scytonema sp. NUACC21]
MSNNTVIESSIQIPTTTKPPPTKKALCNSLETLETVKSKAEIFKNGEMTVTKACYEAKTTALASFLF